MDMVATVQKCASAATRAQALAAELSCVHDAHCKRRKHAVSMAGLYANVSMALFLPIAV